jgi:hypothetical protein
MFLMAMEQDREKPRAKAAGLVVVAKAAPGLNQRFRSEVLGRALVAAQAAGLLQQAGFVLRRQLAKSRRISRPGAGQEFAGNYWLSGVARNDHLYINPLCA